MSIADLGSLGEFIASIAVLVTLVFFTFQMRQNTHAMQSATSAEMVSQWIANANAYATDPELAKIWIRWEQEEVDGSDPEMNRLFYWTLSQLKAAEFAYLQWQSGSLSEELWATNLAGLGPLVQGNPVVRKMWSLAMNNFFTPGFRELVDSTLAATVDSQPNVR